MLKLYEFECQGCGERFEEYIDRGLSPGSLDFDEDGKQLSCPKCMGPDVKRVQGLSAHRKHSSWGVQ